MKKLLLSLLLTIFFAGPILAVDSLSFKMNFKDDNSSTSNDLMFGIHKDATQFLDTALGEKDLPPFAPPDDLHAIFFITDSSTMNRIKSYVDFRPIPQVDQFVCYYRFKLENIFTSYTISWSKIGNYVDSAFIKDIVNGTIVNVNMKATESYFEENYGRDQFNIVVYYNKNFVDVNEKGNNNVKESIAIYPNPVSDELKFSCEDGSRKFTLINSVGKELLIGKIISGVNSIDMSPYSQGLYFLAFEGLNGDLTVKKFIKY